MVGDSCPVQVPEHPVQGVEGLVNGGGNSDLLKVEICLSKIELYAGKSENARLL